MVANQKNAKPKVVSSYESLKCAASLCANFPKVSASKLRLAESNLHCKARHKIWIYTTKNRECQSERVKLVKRFKKFRRFEHEQTFWNVRNPEWRCSKRTRSARQRLRLFSNTQGLETHVACPVAKYERNTKCLHFAWQTSYETFMQTNVGYLGVTCVY